MDFLAGTFAQSIAEKNGEDGVLGHVSAFAYYEIHLLGLLVGEIGANPPKKRHDNPGTMLGRTDSRGHVENQRHPDHHQQPIFEKEFQERRRD